MLIASVGKITNVFLQRVWSPDAIIHCDHVWWQFRAESLFGWSTIGVGQPVAGKPVGQKFDCGHGWRNLINKRAPRGFLPNTPHVRHFRGMIRGPWKWRDWIGRRHVFNKTLRARDRKSRWPKSKPWRDQPGLVEHAEFTLWMHERDTYNYVPLTARRREKPWREWCRYLFFKRGEIDEFSLLWTFSFSAIFSRGNSSHIWDVGQTMLHFSHQ